ncbi:MAG: hypothetical protein ACUVQQ_00360 [Thermogutta sp.]
MNSLNPRKLFVNLVFLALICEGAALPSRMVDAADQDRLASDALKPGDVTDVCIEEVRVGWAGARKPGFWIPVWITLSGGSTGGSGELFLSAPDSEGVVCTYPLDRVAVASNEKRIVESLIRLGRAGSAVTVEWRLEGGRILRRTAGSGRPIIGAAEVGPSPEQPVVLQIGPEPLSENRQGGVAGDIYWVTVTDPQSLPRRSEAYQMVSAVILTTGTDPEFRRRLASCGEAWQALREWVASGGRLVLSVDESAADLFIPEGPLAWAVPGGLAGSVQLRKTAALETYAESPRPLVVRRGEGLLKAAQTPGFQGVVSAKEGNIPLVLRRQYGFGTVVLCTFDLSHRAIREWSQKDRLLDRLLDREDMHAGRGAEQRTLMHHGFNDLSGQLHAALELFHGVTFVPFSTVAILLGVYFVLVGPLDYLLLGRYFPDRRWTWLTFPLILVIVCVSAWKLGEAWKGRGVLVNEVGLLDVDVEGGRVRGIAWANFFTSKAGLFDVTPNEESWNALGSRPASASVGWFASPGRGLGGMEGASLEFGEPLGNYTCRMAGPAARLEGLPVAAQATRAVSAVWEGSRERPYVETDLSDRQQLLNGTVANKFPFALDDAVMIYRGWVYFVGRLEPGASWRPRVGEDRRELRAWLNDRRVETVGEGVQQQARQVVAPYDRSSRDLWYILRMMLFYRAAGGDGYVRLWNSQFAYLDATDWLENGRAILLARADMDSPIGAVAIRPRGAGESESPRRESLAYVRAVLPVRGAEIASGTSGVESGASTVDQAPERSGR